MLRLSSAFFSVPPSFYVIPSYTNEAFFPKAELFGKEHLNLHMLELIHQWCQEVLSAAGRGSAAARCCLQGRRCWQERKRGQGAQGEN